MKLESNIWKLNAIKAVRSFLLIMPILVLFFQENGLSLQQIFWLQSLFSISIFALEVPMGYFADAISRRFSIILGGVFGVIGFAVYAASYSFWWFFLGEFLLAIGAALISGADSALLYDTLVAIKKSLFKKIEGRRMAYGHFSEAMAAITGGFIALISLRAPIIAEAIIMIIIIPLTFSLIEPPMIKRVRKNPMKEMLKLTKFSLHGNKEIKWLIILSGILSSATLTMVWFIQPYWDISGLDLKYFGVAWMLMSLSVAGFSLIPHKFENKFGRKKSLMNLVFLVFIGYLLMGYFQSIWAIWLVVIFQFVRAMNKPIFSDYLNKIIGSGDRATILSVQNLVFRLIFAIMGPIFGALADSFSLSIAFYSAGIFFFTTGIIALFSLKNHDALH